MAVLPTLRVGLTLDSATFVTETRRVNQSIESMGKTVQAQTTLMSRGFTLAGTAARSLAAGLGIGFGTAAISGLANMAQRAIDNADALAAVARQAGLSTDALQALQFQARQSGSSTETLNSGMLTFVRGVGQAAEGTGRLLSQLQKLDPVAAEQIKTAATQEEALNIVADAIERADNAAAKAAIATAAFGGAGKELAVVFEEGATGIAQMAAEAQRLGIILDTDLVAAADQVNDKLDILTTTISAKLTNAVGNFAVSLAEMSGLLEVDRPSALNTELAFIEVRLKALNEIATEPALQSFLRNPAAFVAGDPQGEALAEANRLDLPPLHSLA